MMRIVEVGPRDGLQNEKATVPTAAKIAFIDQLSTSGVHEVEVTAFVSPAWVPQLSDASEVCQGITRQPGVTYSALVPNQRGLERALAARIDKVAVFTAASDTFNQKNVNTDIKGTFARMRGVVADSLQAHKQVRGYISTAFWCPYEGFIEPLRTVQVALDLLALGAHEISVGDTIGKATPDEVTALLTALFDAGVRAEQVALHFHDTYGRAIDNVLCALPFGITIFDTSVAGLGGCPYAPGAPGNVATETVVCALTQAGAPVAVDLAALGAARDLMAVHLGRTL